uniref:Uncharacterized protein n=1 Tax=Anguilla anguilla TaxID=7936 RepID=A0A0E9U007_ANGAN
MTSKQNRPTVTASPRPGQTEALGA